MLLNPAGAYEEVYAVFSVALFFLIYFLCLCVFMVESDNLFALPFCLLEESYD